MRTACCFWLLFGWITCDYAQAEYSVAISDPSDSGIDAKLSAPIDKALSTGVFPLSIRIANNTDNDLSYQVKGESSYWGRPSGSNTQTVTVNAGKIVEQKVYIDILEPPSGNLTSSQNLTFNIQGYGITRGEQRINTNYNTYKATLTPFLAFSNSFHSLVSDLETKWKNESGYNPSKKGKPTPSEITAQFPELSKLLGSDSSELVFVGDRISPAQFPTAWRGYLGFGQLWVSEEDWTQIAPVAREAIQSWVLQGGKLILVAESPSGEFRNLFFTEPQVVQKRGYGKTYSFLREPSAITPSDVAHVLHLFHEVEAPFKTARDQSISSEGFIEQLKNRSESGNGAILFLVLIYALVVGPINVLVWAKKSRALLYITTPVISTIAASLLVLFILFQDGVGGSGERRVAVLLSPGEKKAVLLQDQLVRTGLLLRREFRLSEDVHIRPLKLASDPLAGVNPLKNGSYDRYDDFLSGDWFQNRSDNTHLLESISLTRAEVKIVRDGTKYFVQSSLNAPLENFFFVDPQGEVWRATGVQEGARVALESSTKATLETFINFRENAGGASVKAALAEVRGRANWFYANSVSADAYALSTLAGVHWKPTTGVFTGPIASSGASL